jgi:hypothetical protein
MGLTEEYEKQYSILTAEITSFIGKLSVAEIGVESCLCVQLFARFYFVFVCHQYVFLLQMIEEISLLR